MDDRPLLDGGARKECARLSGMDSEPHGALLEKSVNDVDLALEGLERGERFAQRHIRSRTLRIPMVLVDAVAHEHDSQPLGICGRARSLAEHWKRLQPRQR